MSRSSAQDAGTARANQLAVFLSYGRADDEQFVAALQRQLAGRGIGVWWDRAEMPSRGLTFLQEIRDAVAVAERLVLVVGPAALRSDYVRAEWQYALALSKPVIPVLRIGEMEALPPEVGRVHCIDARATRPAQDAFDELARVLGEPLPPLGAFLTPIPALPPYFQPRTAEMSRLAELLLEDQDRPVTVTGPQRVLVLHGLPGMGKSVTAAAFARSTATRRSFADGVLWLSGRQVTAADAGESSWEPTAPRRRRTGRARGDRRRERARGGRADPEPARRPWPGVGDHPQRGSRAKPGRARALPRRAGS